VTAPIRLGAVNYLNVRPLVHGLDGHADRVRLRFDVPSECARLLAAGAIDLGMVPSITHVDRPGDRIVPGVCIGSDGPVASVALFTRKPMRDVTRIALDTSSRTSAALTRILCARRFEIDPVFIPRPPDLPSMLADADAALLIGDPALFVDARAHGAMKIDLGAEWTAMTHRPFVWAFWAGPFGGVDAPVVALLQEAAAEGMRHTDAIADAYCAETPGRAPLARRYLRQHLMFQLTPRAIEGLREYYSLAAALGLAAERRDLVFF
jgi:predicted solute-binding protein